jgi:hypothetical protein
LKVAPHRDENQLHAAVVELVALTMLKSNIRPYKTGKETKKVVAFSIL